MSVTAIGAGALVTSVALPAVVAYDAPRPDPMVTCTSAPATPLAENQVVPSPTRSNRSVYVPRVGGAITFALTTVVVPGRRSSGSGVRMPSHTVTLPFASSQW